MRIETRTKTVPQQYNVFIADDGTEFAFRDDCENYEEGKKKKVEVKGIIWYDQNGNILPLTLASWEKVLAIHFENGDADYRLYNILEAFCDNMNIDERTKLSAYGNSLMEDEPYLILYNEDDMVWENVTEKYAHIKMWLDKI